MGTKNIKRFESENEKTIFTEQLLKELDILQDLIDCGEIESNIYRVGVELEIFLITDNGSPSPVASKVLENLPDCFTSEYSEYIVELNLNPAEISKNTFISIEKEIFSMLSLLEDLLKKHNSRYVLVGILPSFTESSLSLDSITDQNRYYQLHNFVHSLRNDNHETYISGIDTLEMKDGLKLFGGAVASFQMHYQVPGEKAVSLLNRSQLLTPAIMAISVNSPIFLQKILWHESRIPVFSQSTDHRGWREKMIGDKARACFGDQWYSGSVKEIFAREFAEYDLWLSTEINNEDNENKEPELNTLLFQNGLIYRWNRLCYGLLNDIPTLRIENRYIPAGPSLQDNIDIQLFWTALMAYDGDYFDDLIENTSFWKVSEGFTVAAQHGLNSNIFWDKSYQSISEIVINHLIPKARISIEKLGLKDEEYRLDRIANRLKQNLTGASWQINILESSKYPTTLTTKSIAKTMSLNQYNKTSLIDWDDDIQASQPDTAKDIPGIKPLRVGDDYPIAYIKELADRLDKSYISVVSNHDGSDYTVPTIEIQNLTEIEEFKKYSIKSISVDTPVERMKEIFDSGHNTLAVVRDQVTVKVINKR